MRYCNICLQPDTRPGIRFNVEGVCPACEYQDQLKADDLGSRDQLLEEIISFGKANSASGFDCIIGVSGGKDSTRQALFVRDHLKMNPLLVNLGYPPSQMTQRGANNISNLIRLGFSCLTVYPAPILWKSLMRKGFYNYANWAKSTELALFSAVPRTAIAYQIPLVWWGENAALQLGDLGVLGGGGHDGGNLRNMNTLGGGDISWLLDADVSAGDLIQYTYPSEKEISKAGIRIVFLGYFWRNWSIRENGVFSALNGLELNDRAPHETGDILGVSALDEDWVVVNQYIKYLKFGFGRATDFVNEEIRGGRMSRVEGIEICEKYDGACSAEYIESFCEYIDISESEFWNVIDRYVNKDLFQQISPSRYVRRFKIGVGV